MTTTLNDLSTVRSIIQFLHKHGKHEDRCVWGKWQDDPYMPFMAEWQDWELSKPGLAMIYLGYYTEENGDIVFDPLLVITLRGEEIAEVKATTINGMTLAISPTDSYFVAFIDTVWERHFLPRQGDAAGGEAETGEVARAGSFNASAPEQETPNAR